MRTSPLCAEGDIGSIRERMTWTHHASRSAPAQSGDRYAQNGSNHSRTDRPGWFTREELIERYARRSGRDLSAIRFYEILALFKLAVVIQQIFPRYKRGQTDDRGSRRSATAASFTWRDTRRGWRS